MLTCKKGRMILSKHQIWFALLILCQGRDIVVHCFSAKQLLPKTATAFVPTTYTREKAQSIISDEWMPQKEYSERIGWGRDAHGFDAGFTGLLQPSDPCLTRTYAEFPLTSLDELVDLALRYLPPTRKNAKEIKFVDIGSGCGRLVFYTAMTRRGASEEDRGAPWEVHGIEIADSLHERALECGKQGIEMGIMSIEPSHNDKTNTLSLHLGPAEDYTNLLQNVDVVFAYSTTWPAKAFSPELQALILDPEWSALLSQGCSKGCIAITTDRVLDPAYNWELVGRLDVENADIFGTTGYVHILRE